MITVQQKIEFSRVRSGRRQMKAKPPQPAVVPAGRVPRISKLMALAIRFEGLIRDGQVSDQSELARLAHVTQPRMTQIMNLLHLAPDIQESLLFLPRVESGQGPDPREAAAPDRGGDRLGEAAGDVGGGEAGVRAGQSTRAWKLMTAARHCEFPDRGSRPRIQTATSLTRRDTPWSKPAASPGWSSWALVGASSSSSFRAKKRKLIAMRHLAESFTPMARFMRP